MEWSVPEWIQGSNCLLLFRAILLLGSLLGILYTYITWHHDYWKRKGIPYLEPSFPFGNVHELAMAKIDIGRFYERFYKRFKTHQFGGIFELRNPILVLTDLDLIKHFLTKDFAYFKDRALPPKPQNNFLANNLFAMEGNDWKDMRMKLTPTFSSGKMKLMYDLIEKCSEQLKEFLHSRTGKNEAIDVKEVMSRFTLDIIATCAFGIEINTLADSNTEFFEISQLMFKKSKILLIKRIFMSTFPRLATFFQISLHDDRVKEFVLNLVETTVNFRKKNKVSRNDFLDLLVRVKNHQSVDDKPDTDDFIHGSEGLTMKEMAAQAFVFLAAGFETAASTTTFALYELARHPGVQVSLRREVDDVMTRHGGRLTYQGLQEMTYMDQVVNETLRIYGSAPVLLRKCTEPYRIPGTSCTLDTGVTVIVPTYAIHHDPDLYPLPDLFDPERFTEENTKRRHNYSFLPFGEGPRMCIGMRFGRMQVKAGLATIIANFELSPCSETPEPVKISPESIVTLPLHPIRLQITTRTSELRSAL